MILSSGPQSEGNSIPNEKLTFYVHILFYTTLYLHFRFDNTTDYMNTNDTLPKLQCKFSDKNRTLLRSVSKSRKIHFL
jgi:hypothetical protein